jgi:hypothetical protein
MHLGSTALNDASNQDVDRKVVALLFEEQPK